MTVLNIGSINVDRVYTVPRFPSPGETLASLSASVGLGGKGLNQSVAIARAGGRVRHLGAIGAGDEAIRGTIELLGVATDLISAVDGCLTGSALILVDPAGENLIVLDPGANHRIETLRVEAAIAELQRGDWVLMQNETNILAQGVGLARRAGLRVALAAAPFDAGAIVPVLGDVDLLVLNQIELAQLESAVGFGGLPADLGLLVTLGAQGAELRSRRGIYRSEGFKVDVIDTTGAGDTVLGAFLAALDNGRPEQAALDFAMAAGALQVTRPGAAAAIPKADEIEGFLAAQNHRAKVGLRPT